LGHKIFLFLEFARGIWRWALRPDGPQLILHPVLLCTVCEDQEAAAVFDRFLISAVDLEWW